jgi:photosystem II stability/assembly factor-like uncharacterized protein
MTEPGEVPPSAGGHAGERRREFEAERGLSAVGESLAEPPRLGGKTFRRQEEFRRQRNLGAEQRELAAEDGGGSLYMRGSAQKEELVAGVAPPPAVPTWRSLGPAGIPNGQTYGSGPGSKITVAGRIGAIAVDPSDSAHLLIGSAGGGIWESRDTGANWQPRSDDQPTLSIGALAFDPSDPSVVYAGTGEGNSAYAHLGQGILRSGDGGATWTLIARERFAGFGFYRLLVDPRNPKRLLAALTGGLVISLDGGVTWGVPHPGRTWDLSLAYPNDEQEILFTTPEGLFAIRGSAAPAPLPGLPPKLVWWAERMAVAHVPTDPGQAFVFAASGAKQLPDGEIDEWGAAGLWHRAAIDEPFHPVQLPSITIGKGEMAADALRVQQAAYDWYLAIPERSDDVIYLGAIELLKGERHHANWSWSDISSREGSGDSIHADQHTMTFDPHDPDVLYAGNDGGIFRSPDGGVTWQPLNDGLAISEVEYLTQRPDRSTWILAGLQDNGSVRRESEGEWSQVGLGDGGDCATDLTKPDTCYISHWAMFLERNEQGGTGKWKNITPAAPSEFPGLFYAPLEVNGDIVVKAGSIVCLSTDRGDTWARVQLPPNEKGEPSRPSALAIPSTARVLVGTEWGDLFRIDAGGAGWGPPHKVSRPQSGWISDLLIDVDRPQRCWATFSNPGSVLRSDDEGVSWTDVTANLPAMPVNAIVTDPADRDRVWVACDVGVFESLDAGGSWAVFGGGLPNALAEDLTFYEPDRLLRVGTRSRGVWEAAVG